MNVSEVFSRVEELLGRSIKIEGVLVREKRLWKEKNFQKPWYIASPNSIANNDLSQKILLAQPEPKTKAEREKENEKEDQLYHIDHERLEAFFHKFSTGELSGFSENEMRALHLKLRFGGATADEFDSLMKANLMTPLLEAASLQETIRATARRKEDVVWALGMLPIQIYKASKEGDSKYETRPGFVVGELAYSTTNTAVLVLRNITEAVCDDENSMLHISSSTIDLSEMKLGTEPIVPALHILESPSDYMGQVIRVDGTMATSKNDRCFITDEMYFGLRNPEFRAIHIDDISFFEKIDTTNLIKYGGKYYRMEPMQLVGKISPSHSEPFPVAITDVSAAISRTQKNKVYQWKL